MARHCSVGIEPRVSAERLILLDTQVLLFRTPTLLVLISNVTCIGVFEYDLLKTWCMLMFTVTDYDQAFLFIGSLFIALLF